MIAHLHHCIFIPTPKCATTSIMNALGFGPDPWNHPDAHLIATVAEAENAPELASYFRFSSIRNPFDRFISGWKFCEVTKHRSLLDVIRNLPCPYPVPDDRLDPTTEYSAYYHLVATQKSRLFKSNGDLGVNFLVRYETLQRDFDHVCDLIGMPRCTMPHDNMTQRMPYQEYFDRCPEARETVERIFREDLDTFGYHY